jgi:hypothetical protein
MQVTSTAPSFVKQESVHGMAAYTVHSIAGNQELALTFNGGDPNFAGLHVDENGNNTGGAQSGAPSDQEGNVNVTPGTDENISLFLMVTVLLVLAGVAGMSLRDKHDPLSDAQVLRKHYDLLLSRLARLDDLHAANTIPNDAYRASREDLMGRLGALAMQLRAHGGVHAPDRNPSQAAKSKAQ